MWPGKERVPRGIGARSSGRLVSKHVVAGSFFCRGALATLGPVALLEDKFGEWKPVSRGAGIAWLCFYVLFLLYAFANHSGFLILDFVNLIIHEGGHFFFSWFGYTIMILGGTLVELLVPLLCAIYFFWQREAAGFAFCSFGSLKTFLTLAHTWPTHAARHCPSSAPRKATGPFFSPSGTSLPKTRKSADSRVLWDGLE